MMTLLLANVLICKRAVQLPLASMNVLTVMRDAVSRAGESAASRGDHETKGQSIAARRPTRASAAARGAAGVHAGTIHINGLLLALTHV